MKMDEIFRKLKISQDSLTRTVGVTLLLWLTFVSCSQNPIVETDINQIVVNGILTPEQERQTVLLDEGINIVYIDGLRDSDLVNPLQNARVIVRSDDQEVLFEEVSPGVYQDSPTALRVEPGKTYYLEATDTKGRTVRAQTTVPTRFKIDLPSEGDSVTVPGEITFKWQPSEHASVYQIIENTPEREYPVYYWGSTTSTEISFEIYKIDTSRVESRKFVINASNYSRSDNQRSLNIENGAGSFSAWISESVSVHVVAHGCM